MTHGFWHGRASSSSCLPCWPALRIFFPPPKEGLWVSSVSFWCHCIWNRTHLQPVCIATSVLEGTPAGRCTQRAIQAFRSYCATDRTVWNFPCPPLPLQDHRGSPVLKSLLPAWGWTPWCWGAITILRWTVLKPKIQPHDFWFSFTTYWKLFWLFPSPRSSYLARV